MDCSPPGSSVHGVSQARILEWAVISFSRGSFWPKDWTMALASLPQSHQGSLTCHVVRQKKNKKTKTKIKTSNPLQQKTTKKRSPALFNFHLLPPRFLTPLQLSILLSTILSPRSPSLHTALPSLPFFLNLLGLAGEGERENTGGLEEHRVRVSCLGSLPTSAWS